MNQSFHCVLHHLETREGLYLVTSEILKGPRKSARKIQAKGRIESKVPVSASSVTAKCDWTALTFIPQLLLVTLPLCTKTTGRACISFYHHHLFFLFLLFFKHLKGASLHKGTWPWTDKNIEIYLCEVRTWLNRDNTLGIFVNSTHRHKFFSKPHEALSYAGPGVGLQRSLWGSLIQLWFHDKALIWTQPMTHQKHQTLIPWLHMHPTTKPSS